MKVVGCIPDRRNTQKGTRVKGNKLPTVEEHMGSRGEERVLRGGESGENEVGVVRRVTREGNRVDPAGT